MNPRVDRRLFKRIEGEFSVRYTLTGSDREYYAMTRDLSGGGLRMSVLKKLEPGTDIDLVVFKNNSNSASSRCKGEIVWAGHRPIERGTSKFFDIGVKFKDSSFLCIGNLIKELEEEKSAASFSAASQ